MFAELAPVEVVVRPPNAGVPLWVVANVSARPAGSLPLTGIVLTGVPEIVVNGGMWLTVILPLGRTVTDTVAVEDPAQFVTVTWKVSGPKTEPTGATKVDAPGET
jgi:hypothetical protein